MSQSVRCLLSQTMKVMWSLFTTTVSVDATPLFISGSRPVMSQVKARLKGCG